MKLSNQYFAITGANRGIGLSVAKVAAKEHAHLILILRKSDALLTNELLDLGAKSVKVYDCDLSSSEEVSRLCLKLREQHIDILFNNAGLLTGGLLEEQQVEDIDKMLQVNINSLIHLTRAVLPGMVERGYGKIINNSSVTALMHFPCASTYAASKAAVIAFTNCLQAELQDTGVSTLCLITPGIKTRMFDEIESKYSAHMEVPVQTISTEEYAEQIKQHIFDDKLILSPGGQTGALLWINKYMPFLFKAGIKTRFRRSNFNAK